MKTKRSKFMIAALTAAMLIFPLGLSSCAAQNNAIRIDETADGTTVTLQQGQVLELSLVSNPTTGFSWQLGDLSGGVLVQQGEVEFLSEASGELVGAGGVEVFRFSAEKPGTVTLQLEYRQPWETEVLAEKFFNVTVVVE